MASFLHTAMRTVFPHATYPGERGRRQLIHARAGDAHYRFLDALPRSIPDAFARSFPAERQAGLVALGNVLRTVGALLLMCDPRDLGVSIGEEISRGLRCFEPNLYLYDNYSGGIGQSQPLYRLVEQLLSRAEALIRDCPSESGCPSCAGPAGEVVEGGKKVALELLTELNASAGPPTSAFQDPPATTEEEPPF
jgi:hypothetical protein